MHTDGGRSTFTVARPGRRSRDCAAFRCRAASTWPTRSAAIAAAVHHGVSVEAAAAAIADSDGVPGRMQQVARARGVVGIVDYAHTPDAVERAIAAARETFPGRVLVVLGCGGDRDREKRPMMGKVAAQGADVVVITDDNPRSESPAAIRTAIMGGVFEVDASAARGGASRRATGARRSAGRRRRPAPVMSCSCSARVTSRARSVPGRSVPSTTATSCAQPSGCPRDRRGHRRRRGTRWAGRLVDCPDPTRPVTGAAADSRRVRPGDLYVAIPGARVDGHDFARAAHDAGAVVTLGSRTTGTPTILVPTPWRRWAGWPRTPWRHCRTRAWSRSPAPRARPRPRT